MGQKQDDRRRGKTRKGENVVDDERATAEVQNEGECTYKKGHNRGSSGSIRLSDSKKKQRVQEFGAKAARLSTI